MRMVNELYLNTIVDDLTQFDSLSIQSVGILMDKAKVNMRVYDMLGNLIDDFDMYNPAESNTMTYDMGHRSSGIYFFVATNKDGVISKKVIVR